MSGSQWRQLSQRDLQSALHTGIPPIHTEGHSLEAMRCSRLKLSNQPCPPHLHPQISRHRIKAYCRRNVHARRLGGIIIQQLHALNELCAV